MRQMVSIISARTVVAYLIFKPTRREAEANRQEALHNQGLSPERYRGTARTAEEAHEVQRRLQREGETFDRLWAVDGDSPDAKQADEDLKLRTGINPETGEYIGRKSRITPWDWAKPS